MEPTPCLVVIYPPEGAIEIEIPVDIAHTLHERIPEIHREDALEIAAVWLARLGPERGTRQLREWIMDDPTAILRTPAPMRRALLDSPEQFGPLHGTPLFH